MIHVPTQQGRLPTSSHKEQNTTNPLETRKRHTKALAAIETATAANNATAANMAAEIDTLAVALVRADGTTTGAANVKDAKIRIAELEFAQFGLLATNEPFAPESAEHKDALR